TRSRSPDSPLHVASYPSRAAGGRPAAARIDRVGTRALHPPESSARGEPGRDDSTDDYARRGGGGRRGRNGRKPAAGAGAGGGTGGGRLVVSSKLDGSGQSRRLP